jgi:high-affinity K+ transport system ATPase subunit B
VTISITMMDRLPFANPVITLANSATVPRAPNALLAMLLLIVHSLVWLVPATAVFMITLFSPVPRVTTVVLLVPDLRPTIVCLALVRTIELSWVLLVLAM